MLIRSVRAALAAVFALGSVAAGGAATAAIQDNQDIVQIRIQYADLNLATDTGARVLRHRIHSAAEDACGPQSGDLRADAIQRACVAAKTEDALKTIDSVRAVTR